MQAMLESQQKKLNSPILQYFQDSYSFSPIQNDQSSVLKMSMKCFSKSELPSQNMLNSQSSHLSKIKILILPFWTIHLKKNQV